MSDPGTGPRRRRAFALICLAFKTPNLLKGRALVSDSFDKVNQSVRNGTGDTDPGLGAQTHQEGYNVLFGDYNVAWFADREQRIIYWDTWQPGDSWADTDGVRFDNGQTASPGRWLGGNYSQVRGVLGFSIEQVASLRGSWDPPAALTAMQSALVWHSWDKWVGIDLVDDHQYYKCPAAGGDWESRTVITYRGYAE